MSRGLIRASISNWSPKGAISINSPPSANTPPMPEVQTSLTITVGRCGEHRAGQLVDPALAYVERRSSSEWVLLKSSLGRTK